VRVQEQSARGLRRYRQHLTHGFERVELFCLRIEFEGELHAVACGDVPHLADARGRPSNVTAALVNWTHDHRTAERSRCAAAALEGRQQLLAARSISKHPAVR